MARGDDRHYDISGETPKRVTDEELDDIGDKCYPNTGLEWVEKVTLEPHSKAARRFRDENNYSSEERKRLREKKKLPKTSRNIKKEHGWLYYNSGVVDPVLIAEQVGVRQETVMTWMAGYAERMENKVVAVSLSFNRSVVTLADVELHKANRLTVSTIISEINDELVTSKVLDLKIVGFLEALDDTEDMTETQIKQTLALLKYYSDRDSTRTKKVDMLLKLKKVHEEDAGITMAKKLEEERESAVRKFITNKDLHLFYEKKGHINIKKGDIVDVIDNAENTIAEFADFTQEKD